MRVRGQKQSAFFLHVTACVKIMRLRPQLPTLAPAMAVGNLPAPHTSGEALVPGVEEQSQAMVEPQFCVDVMQGALHRKNKVPGPFSPLPAVLARAPPGPPAVQSKVQKVPVRLRFLISTGPPQALATLQ